ncbi:MarR family winged helix-turn-helix transcriptional regulator [Microbacterium sp. G2-8]|uniref:MarR family winged helix-turn-helix transcriptional regulator n=1 Tax=Microbacterium sp. G2-8 TaxID=2842454 RepID=UPI001C8AEB6C|nr:MarR family transcriptional regulator [Microbacterium sp. G2-8]
MTEHRDAVDRVVAQWRDVAPDLDASPIEIIGRVSRLAAIFTEASDALEDAGLTRHEYEMLSALRRTPHPLTAGDLARETSASGAAVTQRLRLLASHGLIERRTDAQDARVARIHLTDRGRELLSRVMPQQLAHERALLEVLPADDLRRLADLLSTLLAGLDGRR